MERKPLPIGIEDFKEVIDSGYYFVDKTLMIKDLPNLLGLVKSPTFTLFTIKSFIMRVLSTK